MKKTVISILTIILFSFPDSTFAGTPTIDGSFDGTGTWGDAVATADGTAGWSSANAKKVYVTYDATYFYFGAEVTASDWMQWAFVLNTTTGGGSSEVWSRSITYGHTNLPDYVIVGHFGNYAELRSWSGSSWSSTTYTSNMSEDETSFVEVKVTKSDIGSPSSVDVQFYLTGNDNNHGTFDACPNDENPTSWDHSGAFTTLDAFQTDVSLPVELSSFTANQTRDGDISLAWTTESEIENLGFIIERRTVVENGFTDWTEIADYTTHSELQGQGSVTHRTEYQFTDTSVETGLTYDYRLADVSYDGIKEYHSLAVLGVEVIEFPNRFALHPAFPNPFNPVTTISYDVLDDGFVTINIYNVSGQKVASLVNDVQTAGKHQAGWYPNNIPSGIYFCKMTTGKNVFTQKLLYLK